MGSNDQVVFVKGRENIDYIIELIPTAIVTEFPEQPSLQKATTKCFFH